MNKPISLALVLLLGFAGLGHAQEQAEKSAGQEVVLRVNGTPITETMIDFHLQRRTQGQAVNLSPEQRDALIRELVDMMVLSQAAQRQGLDEDPQVRARIESVRHALLAQAAVEQFGQGQEISQEQVQSEYDKMYGGERGQEYRARHILLEDKEAAQEVIQQLEEGGDFAELAKERSTGPSAEVGGDLGWFQPEQMVEPFSDAVGELEPGEYTKEPVKTRFGWHVILLEEARTQPAPELAEVEPQIRGQLAQQQIQQRIEQLRQQAKIEYVKPEAKPEQAQGESKE